MKTQRTIVALLCATLVSCSQQPGIKPGDHAADGSLILHVFSQNRTNKPVPVTLATDYGMMVFNDGTEAKPQARFILASKSSDSIQTFTRLSDFKAALFALPQGSDVAY